MCLKIILLPQINIVKFAAQREFYGIARLCNKGLAIKYGRLRSAKFKKKLWIKHIGGFFLLAFANLQKTAKTAVPQSIYFLF